MPCQPVPSVPTLMGEVPGSRRASEDEQGNRTYSLSYEIWSPPEYGARAVAAVLPFRRGNSYSIGEEGDDWLESDRFAMCTAITVAQASSDGTKWRADVAFGPIQLVAASAEGDSGPVAFENPTLAPPTLSWSSEAFEEVVDRDINGVAIVNTAGTKPNPGVTRPRSRRILQIAKLIPLAEWDDTVIDQVENTLNVSTFYGRAAKTVLCAKLTANLDWNTNIGPCVHLQGEFHIDPTGWRVAVLNDGTRQKIGDCEFAPILVGGQPVSEPVPLAADGSALECGQEPIYLTFEVIPTSDFTILGLGS